MPNGVLSEREYDLLGRWYARTSPWKFPRGMPKNVEGIRENPLYLRWLREEPIARPTARAKEILEEVGYPISPKAIFAEPTIQELMAKKRGAEAEVAGIDLAGAEVPSFPTAPPPPGFRWAFDRDLNRYVPQFAGLTAAQQAEQQLAQQQLAGFPPPTAVGEARPAPRISAGPRHPLLRELAGETERAAPAPAEVEAPADPFGRTATWNARLGQWDYPPNWGQRPADQPDPFQQEQFGLQEQQFKAQQQQFQQQLEFQQTQLQAAQEEQERQYRAQLAAQPINWLQYAAYTGEEPVVQPWMVPLGFQNTGGAVTPGQPIPGFEGQAGQQQIQTFAGLPQLTTPSAQLQARWGPTAQAQFLGYRQARTGALPEESQFRLGSQRAPTGAFGGFSSFR